MPFLWHFHTFYAPCCILLHQITELIDVADWACSGVIPDHALIQFLAGASIFECMSLLWHFTYKIYSSRQISAFQHLYQAEKLGVS